MIDQAAYFIGYAVLVLGGGLVAVLAIVALSWVTFEYIVKRTGYLKRIIEWREAAKRELAG
jgi:uncharacterized membrane protein